MKIVRSEIIKIKNSVEEVKAAARCDSEGK